MDCRDLLNKLKFSNRMISRYLIPYKHPGGENLCCCILEDYGQSSISTLEKICIINFIVYIPQFKKILQKYDLENEKNKNLVLLFGKEVACKIKNALWLKKTSGIVWHETIKLFYKLQLDLAKPFQFDLLNKEVSIVPNLNKLRLLKKLLQNITSKERNSRLYVQVFFALYQKAKEGYPIRRAYLDVKPRSEIANVLRITPEYISAEMIKFFSDEIFRILGYKIVEKKDKNKNTENNAKSDNEIFYQLIEWVVEFKVDLDDLLKEFEINKTKKRKKKINSSTNDLVSKEIGNGYPLPVVVCAIVLCMEHLRLQPKNFMIKSTGNVSDS